MLSYDILRDELSLYNAVYQFSLPKYKCHTWRVARIVLLNSTRYTNTIAIKHYTRRVHDCKCRVDKTQLLKVLFLDNLAAQKELNYRDNFRKLSR